MSSVEKNISKEAYDIDRRKWIDQRRKKRLKSKAEVELDWTGVCTSTLRTMKEVEDGTRLAVGQKFPNRNLIVLRTAEEANLCGIYVTILKAMMLLIELECKRYRKQQAEAWNHDGILTSRGNLEFDESFNDLYHTQFRIAVAERDDVWVCLIKRIEMGREHAVTIPKEPVHGSHFGRCTCGVDRQDSAPCEHMAAVAASSRLPGVTRHNVMPYWWTRAHWRMQIPQEALGVTNVSMSSIIADKEPDHNLCYCPNWTANQISGRPKKDKRKTLVLESATGSKGMKRATGLKRARRYCQICGKYNHITNECWKLGSNAHKHPGFFLDNPITEEGDGAPIDGTEGSADASEESNKEEQSHEDSQMTSM